MRTLKFVVDGQLLTQAPTCNFGGLVPGSEKYLKAEFSFSSEWNGYVKVVEFTSILGKEYTPQVLRDGRTCLIPAEALRKRAFKVRVIGKRNGEKLQTDKVLVKQSGGKT